jgi:hypothetical protein
MPLDFKLVSRTEVADPISNPKSEFPKSIVSSLARLRILFPLIRGLTRHG